MMTIARIVSRAARPGVFSGSLASSFIVMTVSQPQNRKIDSATAAATGEKSPAENGLNQSMDTGVGSKAAPPATWTSVATADQPRARAWDATSHAWSLSVAATPREEIHAAAAGRTSVTGMLIHRTRVGSAICGSLKTWDRRRKRKSTATAARFE